MNLINKEVNPTQTTTVQEFILNTLCKSFELYNAKQASGFLDRNYKYLAEAILEGYYNRFEPASDWFDLLSKHSQFLSKLINDEYKTFSDREAYLRSDYSLA